MRALVFSATVLIAVSATALAQPYPSGAYSGSLPIPATNEASNDSVGNLPSDYLRSAQGALAAGRTREAQEALEMAQTRLLDRSVPLGQTNDPSDNPTVGQISQARQALAARDRNTCMQLIQTAIGSATAQGL